MTQPANEYLKLDALRAAAACVVVAYHSCFYTWGSDASPLGLCQVIVDFFFMVSGFVMTHAYMRQIQGGLSFKAFAQVRLGRVLPLHVATMVLLLGYVLVARAVYDPPPDRVTSVSTFVTHFLLLNSYGLHDELYWNIPSWSVSAELLAYAVFFALASTVDDKRRIVPPVALSAGLYAFLLVRYPHANMDLTFEAGAVRGLAGFFLGSALFRIRERWSWLRELRGRKLHVAELSWFALYSVCLFSRGGRRYAASLLVLNAVGILLFTAKGDGVLGRALRWKPAQIAGTWTYSMYLIHYPIICVVFDFLALGPFKARATIANMGLIGLPVNALLIGFVLVLSKLSYTYVEEPARRWTRRIAFAPRSTPRELAARRARNA